MALSLYVNTFRLVLKVSPGDTNSWSHIYGSLCCLRESLTCGVCGKLLIIPKRPASVKCQHNVCKQCVGGKVDGKPQCKWCMETQDFEENTQLRIILQCYKRMCKYIISSEIFRCWRSSKLTSPMLRFISMVYEGAGLEDDYTSSDSTTLNGSSSVNDSTSLNGCSSFNVPSNFSVLGSQITDPSTFNGLSSFNGPSSSSSIPPVQSSTVIPKIEIKNTPVLNGHRTVYSIKLSDIKSPKVMIKKTSVQDAILAGYVDSDVSSDTSGFDGSNLIEECLRSIKKRKNCRCGMATRNPGKLTCCGQRCPCYVGGRACLNCHCRGCRNPQKKSFSCARVHGYHNTDASTDNDMEVDADSSDDISCSDSDKETA